MMVALVVLVVLVVTGVLVVIVVVVIHDKSSRGEILFVCEVRITYFSRFCPLF